MPNKTNLLTTFFSPRDIDGDLEMTVCSECVAATSVCEMNWPVRNKKTQEKGTYVWKEKTGMVSRRRR